MHLLSHYKGFDSRVGDGVLEMLQSWNLNSSRPTMLERLYVQGMEWQKSTRGLWQRMLKNNYPVELQLTLMVSISYSKVGVGKDCDEGD